MITNTMITNTMITNIIHQYSWIMNTINHHKYEQSRERLSPNFYTAQVTLGKTVGCSKVSNDPQRVDASECRFPTSGSGVFLGPETNINLKDLKKVSHPIFVKLGSSKTADLRPTLSRTQNDAKWNWAGVTSKVKLGLSSEICVGSLQKMFSPAFSRPAGFSWG